MPAFKKEIIVSPVNGQPYVERTLSTKGEAIESLKLSQAAFSSWKTLPLKERINYISKFIQEFINLKDEVAQELTWLIGRPHRYNYNEVNGLEERARYLVSIAESSLTPIELEPKENFKRYMRKEPLGVVLIIAPWNYPYLTSVNAVVPALLAGNTVILKHSPQTFPCAERFAQAFKKAGLPDGVFQYLNIDHDVAADLLKNPIIKHIQFTGSVRSGLQVLQTASSANLAGVAMELGGKDAAYVRSDADLDFAAENVIDGAFYNSGQSCCAVERVYVHQDVYEEFITKVKKVAEGYVIGDPFDANVHLGPVVKTQFADLIRDHVQDALQKGAKALVSEDKHTMCKPNTPYVAPQVFVNVNHNMKIMKDETFGPVVGIMKVSTDEEAIQLVNDSEFGLTASIWTKDLVKAEEIADQLS